MREPTAGALTLHERIRSGIEQKILSGIWKPGDRIPSEFELVEQYGCSRMTVSKAIGELVQAGMVVRRRKAGSFVAQPPIHSGILEVPDIQTEILKRGQAYGYVLLGRSQRKSRKANAVEVDLAGNGELLELECVHFADKRPFAYEKRLINISAVPQSVDANFAQTPPGTWLLSHVPWTTAEHRISAVGADLPTAKLLDVPTWTPCLLLERQTWHDGVGVTHVWQTFPGDSYDLVATFAPSRSS